MSEDLPYTYFVSYFHGQGFGNTGMQTKVPFTSYNDIKVVQGIVAAEIDTDPADLIILNWILLSGPKTE